ncbi:hypothetical protein [Brevibacillus dissolubilis]|uniref:hypothetical protein n=1 Tax=Brevibacillus dissolubilis TaxID=1844116 RepID=UPI00111611D6|nr:hypothetical protein [Brevibacillus dissolubilis]
MDDFIKNLTDDDLISCYGKLIAELKQRGIIRSKNVVGDLGEYLAINYYCKTKGLPNLIQAPPSTKYFDAISNNGDRYSINATTRKVTSVFYGLNDPDSMEDEEKRFEYVILVQFDENLILKRINELTWEQFLKYKRWHKTMKAWNLSINNKMLNESKTIYLSE